MRKKDSAPEKGNAPLRLRWLIACGVMLLCTLALISYHAQDNDVIRGGSDAPLQNWIGSSGAFFSCYLLLWFGLCGYLIVLLFLLRSLRHLMPAPGPKRYFWAGVGLLIPGTLLLLGLAPEAFASVTENLGLGGTSEPALGLSGGLVGQFLAAPGVKDVPPGCLRNLIGAVGTMVTGWIMVTVGGILLYISDWHAVLCRYVFAPGSAAVGDAGRSLEKWADERRRIRAEEAEAAADEDEEETEDPQYEEAELEHFSRASEQDLRENDADDDADEADDVDFLREKKTRRSRLADLFRLAREDDDEDDDADEETADAEDLPPAPPVSSAAAARPAPAAPAATCRETPVRPPETPDVSTRVVQPGEKVQGASGEYVLPLTSMLAKGADVVGENQESIEHSRAMLQKTLEDFAVAGHVSGFTSGPRVTRFEITLDPGVNVKKVEQIADNIALSLAATSVRVLAPIPGRSVVGVEVSNTKPEAVFMRSVLEDDKWKNGKAEIPIALGKDVAGVPMVLDLAKAPHLLIAGATGTGKSVCTNSLIVSLLFRFRPDELKLIMVDPKVVEFDSYRKLPHLLTPIINESAKVPIALRWAANEMDRRYHVLAKAGVKKLSEFNHRPIPEEPQFDDFGNPIPDKMPLLVIIIDELADLMMTEAKKDVETNITRIAQKGRAAGIHIIVATQRPSTNVITGVIKANLPSRICFQVRSMTDSRVVLDTNGAEKLLGMGDMLVMSSSSMVIERVQGAFVKDDDIKQIVKFVSDQAPQHFNDTVLAEPEEGGDEDGEIDEEYESIDPEDRADIAPLVKKYLRPGDDDTMKQALEVVILDRKASTSYLQRRLRIGYNRAAELIDQMEERGIVGPPSGSGNKRDILVFDGMEIGE